MAFIHGVNVLSMEFVQKKCASSLAKDPTLCRRRSMQNARVVRTTERPLLILPLNIEKPIQLAFNILEFDNQSRIGVECLVRDLRRDR
ncbi:Hypothetical protein PP7435_CHR3-1930 [Komagataella phaffii CBS 7435]|uniref:Uncharacterized protein n=1 Tax=Komagataella phaffii (strain ATCC 76273 / CBS 7435 / CECT 11047 / NRRL Y-11430 / Wegner 21-1) TaxID=981350 RepID=A0A1G4KQD2_KOMPC|nr:Hypothetical protein BQ9382_C3-2895 [Komagataella phaffii CBS 7435]SCV12214.1 Hypothetical protein PP7435_CHR3-1930 [Komagataella phaffii CBS 7435]